MDWSQFDNKVIALAIEDRENPKRIGDLLNEGEDLFGEQYAQVLNYFPIRKHSTIANWKSICRSVPKEVRPGGERISQMDAVRALPHEKQKEMLTWAVENNFGREEILDRMETEGLRIPRTGDAIKYVQDAIKKLDKALPLADDKLRDAIKLAKPALEDGLK